MGKRLIITGADFSENSLDRIISMNNLQAQDFDIGKLVDKTTGLLIDNIAYAVSPIIEFPQDYAVFSATQIYRSHVFVYKNDKVTPADGQTTESFASVYPSANDKENWYCRILLTKDNVTAMTEAMVSAALNDIRIIKDVEVTSDLSKLPVLNGIASGTSGSWVMNENRIAVGPFKYKGTISINGGFFIKNVYSYPYAVGISNCIQIGTYTNSITSDGTEWIVISCKKTNDTLPFSSIAELTSMLTFQ